MSKPPKALDADDENESIGSESQASLATNPATLFPGIKGGGRQWSVHYLLSKLGSIQELNQFVAFPNPANEKHTKLLNELPVGQFQLTPLLEPCKQFLAKKLRALVLDGKQKEAEKMLQVNPELLFIKGITKDHAHRTIEGSAYQCALGADDVDSNVNPRINKSMLEMMKPYIEAFPETALKQYQEQFPDNLKPAEKIDFEALENAVNKETFAVPCDLLSQRSLPVKISDPERAILVRCGQNLVYDNPVTGEYLERALTAEEQKAFDEEMKPTQVARTLTNAETARVWDLTGFVHEGISRKTAQVVKNNLKEKLRPKPKEVLRQGKHMDVEEILGKAFEVYSKKWGTWNDRQCSFFWRRIIGQIEAYLPVNYAQALCMGLANVKRAPQITRSLALDDGKQLVNDSSKLALSVHFAVYSYQQGTATQGWGWPGSGIRVGQSAVALIELCKDKKDALSQHAAWLNHLVQQRLLKNK